MEVPHTHRALWPLAWSSLETFGHHNTFVPNSSNSQIINPNAYLQIPKAKIFVSKDLQILEISWQQNDENELLSVPLHFTYEYC